MMLEAFHSLELSLPTVLSTKTYFLFMARVSTFIISNTVSMIKGP